MTDRERMKRLAITNKTIEFTIKMSEAISIDTTGVIVMQIKMQANQTITAMSCLPSKLFRRDSPRLDKRRLKRHYGKGIVLRQK